MGGQLYRGFHLGGHYKRNFTVTVQKVHCNCPEVFIWVVTIDCNYMDIYTWVVTIGRFHCNCTEVFIKVVNIERFH